MPKIAKLALHYAVFLKHNICNTDRSIFTTLEQILIANEIRFNLILVFIYNISTFVSELLCPSVIGWRLIINVSSKSKTVGDK